ncbi:beta transducin-like protein [Fusarium bulbicola]|nr:beta transducin-like protein [Fusarium bulbicola]
MSDVSAQTVPSSGDPKELDSWVEDAKYLLVDDNKVNMKVMKHHFDRLGLKYNIAWNGQEAVDLYRAHPEQCKLILLDISMPVMGGMQASLLTRQHERENDLQPAIIIGLMADPTESENRRMIDEFGMNTTIKKPVRLEGLRELVNTWPNNDTSYTEFELFLIYWIIHTMNSAALDFPPGFTLHEITSPEELEQWTPSLTQLLLSCVNDDPSASSIGFHAPLTTTKATEFWSSQSPQLFGLNPRATLFVLARDTTAVGTISLVTHPKETHAHKVEVGKLLVSAAPSRLIFLYDDWSVMSERDEIVDLITQITGIDQAILSPPTADCFLQSRLHAASIAEKMSWASQRQTTRIEDTAYCLLGIFGINMPLLYGEGENAFMRLQEEIMKRSDDQTLLAWYPEAGPADSGVLATSPAAFANCKDFIPCDVGMPTPPFQMTNKGLRIEMPLSSDSFSDGSFGLLQCRTKKDPTTMIAIPLASYSNNLYVRMTGQPLLFLSYQYWRAWPFTSVNLLPSFSFTSSIVQPPTYTVFLESIPENFYIAEVYPPNQS